ncbi:hypothetical protein CAOG_02818 [Capsaspora owczarzaki ATCC 30864]|uniref:hypothetical protein n=1 Tax=Capsaspora owczarzaki (strain ATCC 30864) TaxID=595528 RepID=UPI0001FE63B3|nr:hypothetical protein CAOG_02818 [Capsaspora owczarzaki ATCC 30864]|eukprot:XP_004348631.1 hypothetical protein CAOG_02818 [Capsaspora owczarzaki ATCC 30864]
MTYHGTPSSHSIDNSTTTVAAISAARFRVALPKPEHLFLAVSLYIQVAAGTNADAIVVDAPVFKSIVLRALKQLHGQLGAGIPVDVLDVTTSTANKADKADKADKTRQVAAAAAAAAAGGLTYRALIRVPDLHSAAVWSALTAVTVHDNRPCRLTVDRASPSLLHFASNSRAFNP